MHTLVDLRGNLPVSVYLTSASVNDVKALDELGGNNERKSLKKRIKKLSEKNESLKQKLSEKNKQYDEVYKFVSYKSLLNTCRRFVGKIRMTETTKKRFYPSFPQLFYPLVTRQFFCDFHEKSEDFCVS